jgi:hypothetical protein
VLAATADAAEADSSAAMAEVDEGIAHERYNDAVQRAKGRQNQ